MIMIKTCKYCGKEYKNRDIRSAHCTNNDCKKQYARDQYSKKRYNKTCKYCGSSFTGRRNEVICKECKGTRQIHYEKIKVAVHCKGCNRYLHSVTKSKTRNITTIKSGYCFNCTEKSKMKLSLSKQRTNNPNWNPNKITRIPLSKKELSRRMVVNNPMYDPEIVKRVSNTLKEGYASGRIVKRFGKDSPTWRGNRYFGQVVRTRLKNWIRSVMERDNFTCQRCGVRGGRLEVHHEVPLRDIINMYLTKYGYIKGFDIDIDSDDYSSILTEIYDHHDTNLSIGTTLCSSCHSEIDNKRYWKEGHYYENNKNRKKEV